MNRFFTRALLLALTLCSLWAGAAHSAWPSGGGSGTALDPYILLTPADLAGIGPTGPTMSASYKQGADIDLAGYDAGDGGGWNPIGLDGNDNNNNLNVFTGTFDGNGYVIRNLTINRATTNNVALFYHATIPSQLINIHLLDVQVSGYAYTGALAGVSNGLVRNCSSTGTIIGASTYTGGLIGRFSGTMVESWSTAQVTGLVGVGGLVGDLFNHGSGNPGIQDSYATGHVHSMDPFVARAGGLVGQLVSNVSIQNSFATGSVTSASGVSVGGLVGLLNGFTGTVTNAYWDTQTSGQATSAVGTGKTTAEMMQLATFAGVDFVNTWGIVEGQTYPYLLASEVFVTYDGNGHTAGSEPVDGALHLIGDAFTVRVGGTLARAGYAFDGWNTAADGSGTAYVAGDTFVSGHDVMLYARWAPLSLGVTYDGNGHTAGSAPVDGNSYVMNDTVTVLDAGTLARTGQTFAGWNTQADGSGTAYRAGATFHIDGPVTLYAQWRSQTTSFSGGGALSLPSLALLLLLLAARQPRRNEHQSA